MDNTQNVPMTAAELSTFAAWLAMQAHVEFQTDDPDGVVCRTVLDFAFDVMQKAGYTVVKVAD